MRNLVRPGGESDAGVEDGARGVCALKVEAVEKGIGVGRMITIGRTEVSVSNNTSVLNFSHIKKTGFLYD